MTGIVLLMIFIAQVFILSFFQKDCSMNKNHWKRFSCLVFYFMLLSCNDGEETTDTPKKDMAYKNGSYGYDADFLKKNTRKVLELVSSDGKAKILLSADYQGRVMTSTSGGDTGTSYGWLNYNLIGSEKKQQFNPVGGEERFWLGPEGGQYSIYFKGKDSFSFSNWQVPPIIDTVQYHVASATNQEAVFKKKGKLTNYSGSAFDLEIERKIRLLSQEEIDTRLQITSDTTISMVGYETINSIKNAGNTGWKKEKGLLSIWLLAMLTPSEKTYVIIPFDPVKKAADFITDDYFGKIPEDRLRVMDSIIILHCDGKFRSKIGVSPAIAKSIAGSYDFKKNILTLTMFSIDKKGRYVNSKWELQKQPYKGDAVNAYNDGPLEDGSQMGPFYEIESSSPALELNPGQSQVYKQSTYHLQGEFDKLQPIAQKLLGVDLNKLK
jgi:hypothetical protein